MNHKWIGIGLTIILISFLNLSDYANAQTLNPTSQIKLDSSGAAPTKIITKADKIADAPSVRLAVSIGGKSDSFEVLLNKGVASVSRPYTGLYCIHPSNTNLNVLNVVPAVSITDSGDIDFEKKFVQYLQDRPGLPWCPDSNSIVAYTYQYWGDQNFPFRQSNEVSFSMIVP